LRPVAPTDTPIDASTVPTVDAPVESTNFPTDAKYGYVKEKSKLSKRNQWFYGIGSFLLLCSLAAVIVAVILDLKERWIEPNTNNLEMLDGTCKTLEEP